MADDTAMWWATPPPYAPAVSEFTTPEDLRRARISSAMGRDVYDGWGGLYNFLTGGLESAPMVAGARVTPPSPMSASMYRLNTRAMEPAVLAARNSVRAELEQLAAAGHQRAAQMLRDMDARAGVTPRQGGQPTQGQRDLYALDPRGEPVAASRMLRDMDRSEAYWRSRRAFDQMQPPPRNRMHSLAPLGALPFLGLNDMGDY